MSKFVLRCKANHNYFLESCCGKNISFINDAESAKEIYKWAKNFDEAELRFALDFNQLTHSLFEVYEIPIPKYVIRVVGTELYIESIFNYTQFTEELFYALDKPTEAEIKEVLNRVKSKTKSKLEIVKL